MRTALLSSAISLLLPLSASAQSLVQETVPVTDQVMLLDRLLNSALSSSSQATHVVPLWSTPDGRVLAAVALSNPTLSPLAPVSPQVANALDWRLIDATALFAGQLDIRLGNGMLANARFSQTPMLLSDVDPLAQNACSSLGALTALAGDACPDLRQKLQFGQLYSGDIGADWTNGPISVDVNLGLAWLTPAAADGQVPALRSVLPSTPITNSRALPALVLPGNDFYRLDSSTAVGAHGRWAFKSGQSIDLGANFGRIRLAPDAAGSRTTYNQTALSLGLGNNTLSGNITGRIFNPLTAGLPGQQRWTGIDLGVTWHMPWQAELSVGAQNLWTSPPLTGNDADNQARTPYVQYHQDL